MESWIWIVLVVLVMTVLVLCQKVYLMRKSAQEMAELVAEIIGTESNSLITISSRDRCMRSLADSLNRQMRVLRGERHRFQQGDQRLKEAITNLSHDIRTPLTAICGYLDLLGEEEQSADAIRYLQIIRSRSEVLKDLTEELFHYAVITSSDVNSPKQEDVILNHVLEECLSDCYVECKERHIEPEIRMPEQEVHRQLNKNAVLRIYENVIGNAMKYSDGDLRILLSETGETIFSNHAFGLMEVEVSRLFERFYTVEDARDATGLGLAVAKTLTEQMGGEIRMKYSEGELRISICFA